MSGRGILLAFLLGLISRGSLVLGLGPCDEIARLADASATEESALRDATAEGLQPHEAKRIGEGVYRVPHANGQSYVIRVGNWKQDIAFEGFAHEFLRDVPGVEVVGTVSLDATRAEAYLTRLKTSLAFRETDLRNRAEGPSQVSIALFLGEPAQTGTGYVSENGISCEAREQFIRLMDPAIDLGSEGRAQVGQELARYLKTAPLAAQRTFLEDLKVAYPKDFRGTDTDNLAQKLSDFWKTARMVAPTKMIELGLNRYPAALRRQLADHWLARSVLGDSDFNPDNWLIYKGRVISIDFALGSAHFTEGRAHLPFSNPFSYATREQMLAWASPEVKRYLRSLNADKLRAIAAKSGRTLTEVELKGILDRAGRVPAE